MDTLQIDRQKGPFYHYAIPKNLVLVFSFFCNSAIHNEFPHSHVCNIDSCMHVCLFDAVLDMKVYMPIKSAKNIQFYKSTKQFTTKQRSKFAKIVDACSMALHSYVFLSIITPFCTLRLFQEEWVWAYLRSSLDFYVRYKKMVF